MAKTIDQISIFVENKAGSLVDITRSEVKAVRVIDKRKI